MVSHLFKPVQFSCLSAILHRLSLSFEVQAISLRSFETYSPGASSTKTVGTWKKMQKVGFFRDGSLTSPERKYINSPKIPVVLNAWERKIQDGRHFADLEN